MSPILEFENVERSYQQGRPVLNGVTFRINEGEVLGLLGRNGAGKSTLLKIAIGLLTPQGGTVRTFGMNPVVDPVAVKQRIGYVAEDQVLPAGSTVAELIAFHQLLFPRWDGQLERQLLERFALDPTARIGKLSKGQAREVALLCAICHRPELLILDEPAGGLDPVARRDFLEASIQLLNREGSAIIFSSHHMGDVERMGGRVVMLDAGKVLLDQELDQLREDFCVVLMAESQPAAARLATMPGCLRARKTGDGWHAVFRGAPEAVSAAIGGDGFRCSTVPLEELFVELVGGHA